MLRRLGLVGGETVCCIEEFKAVFLLTIVDVKSVCFISRDASPVVLSLYGMIVSYCVTDSFLL
jgi:hypothetical protein